MKQTIIFTALPHRRTSTGGEDTLKLSVVVSIRLDAGPQATLASFPDIRKWTQHIKNASYSVQFGNMSVPAQLHSEKIDDALWDRLMHDNILVKAYAPEDLTTHRILSYPARHVTDFVLGNYQKYAISNPTRSLDIAEFTDPEGLGAISRYRPLSQEEYDRLKNQPRRSELSEAQVFGQLKIERRILERSLNLGKDHKYIPYKDQQNPTTDFLQLRDFHRVERKPLSTPPPKLNKPEFEFHDVLSIVSSYPQIQRKLALVLDFSIPFDNGLPKNNLLHFIPSGLDFQDETDISCPRIAYAIGSDGFNVRSKADSIIDQGFVQVNTPAFEVFQVDADGAALKLNNEVENKIIEDAKLKIVNINLAGSQTLQAKRLPEEKPEEAELPALRSAGIALARNGLAEALHQRFQQANQMHSKLLNKSNLDNALKIIVPKDNDALYADDIVQGYRMDIALSSAPDTWYSLHWKKDIYTYYDSDNEAHDIQDVDPDEGFVQIAAAEDTEGGQQLFSGEVMFRWEGWSLSVIKPGYAINEEDDTHEKDYVHTSRTVEAQKYALDKDLEFKLNAVPQIVQGTLPKLRFGEEYMIRVRTVDMAGNSRALEEKTPNPDKNEIRSFRYKRYEPVASPIIVLGNHLRDGESLEHLVVRSNYDQTAEEYEENHPLDSQIFESTAVRHLLPPKNSQLMAEQHGKFDKAFGGNPSVAREMYDFIVSREGHLDFGEEGRDKVYQTSDVEVIYLPDPMGAGVSLFLAEGYDDTHTQEFRTRQFSFFTNDELTGKNTNIDIPEDQWHSGKSMRIQLREGSRDAQWNAAQRTLVVTMPKGERTRIRFSTWWRASDIEELSAMWDLIRQKAPGNLKELRDIAESGKHWMISPSRELELVHAVQQPVEPPEIQKVRGDRNYDQTSAYIHTNIKVHGNSTGKLDIQARWKEPLDLPHHVAPELVEKSGEINDVEVDYHDDILQKGSFPEDQEKTKPAKKGAPLQLSVITRKRMALLQQFPDTKHRRVSYLAIAASRYQDYFAGLMQQDMLTVTRDSGLYEDVIIPNSARPMKPEIEYIIPTFEWRKASTDSAMRHRRLGGGLRVYIKRPWYSSGEGEKLAVVLPGPTDPKLTVMMVGGGLNPFVTHWGVDPIKLSRPSAAFSPAPEQFRLSPHVDSGLAFPGNEQYKVTAVAYPVEFDTERKLWYCDLAVDHGAMYYPFIKLALARYQQHSVRKDDTDVCLSEIVQADFVQLVPERVCTVDFKKDDLNTKFTITVEGTMSLIGRQYSPTNYIVMSFYSTELAQPRYMHIDDNTNDKDLEKERLSIEITEKDIKNDRFTISKEFKLPRAYKRDPFVIILEEYEKGPAPEGRTTQKLSADAARENQPRLVFADRFDVNAVEK